MRPSRQSRGSVLFVVLIVVLAITVLGTALVVVSGRHLASARLHETNNGLSNCAMAVRQYLAANIAAGTLPTSVSLTIPGAGSQTIKLTGGHYDSAAGTFVNVPSFGSSASTVQNVANQLPTTVLSGAPQQMGTAICTDADGRTYEVEFSWK